jgi:prepilin-type processing-associated H-X9-DG protein
MTAAVARADFNPDAHARTVAPFLDNQTIAVLHIDVTRIDIDILCRKVIDMGQIKPEEDMHQKITETGKNVRKWLLDFNYAGGKDIYVILSLADFPKFFIIVPPQPQADLAALKELLKSTIVGEFDLDAVEYIKGAIVAAHSETIQRLKNMTAVPSDTLADAFTAAGDSAAQLLIVPTPDQRRVLAEMAPPLPEHIGAVPTTPLARALNWIALGVDGPPDIKLNLTVQTPDPVTAQAAHVNIMKIYQALRIYNQRYNSQYRLFEKMLTLLTPTVKENQVILQLNHEKANTILTDFLTPMIIKERERAQLKLCAHQLKALGTAIFVYQNDHEGKNPPDPQSLFGKGDIVPDIVYRGADLNDKVPSTMILIHDKLQKHQGRFVDVFFADGHVEQLNEQEFQKAIERDNESRRQLELPEKPAQ